MNDRRDLGTIRSRSTLAQSGSTRDDSEVIRSTALRLFTRLPLVACLALGCEWDEPAPPPPTVNLAAPTASAPSESPSAPAPSELYVDADGTVEPADAMDHLVSIACGDGPVPEDLEIVFGEEPSTLDIVGSGVPHGLYASNRVVFVLSDRGNLHGNIDNELVSRTPGRSLRSLFRATIHGSFSHEARRELWCATARDMASVPPLSPDCRATDAWVRSSVRIRTGGREWRRRVHGAAHCPWRIVARAAQRFRGMVSNAPLVPVAFLELPVRVANDCPLPTDAFSANVVLGPDGRTTDVTLDRGLVSEDVAQCIANLARVVDVSDWIDAVKTNDFDLARVELTYYWRGGRPLAPPRGRIGQRRRIHRPFK